MIVKELDTCVETGDVFAQAGHRAEKQMAFYLHRAFGERKDVYVLNGLRLNRGEDVAQMDHLVVHQTGMVIVESKSVRDTVRVNEHGEWTRVYGRQQQGMASPIEQAKRQATFLKRFLDDHAPQVSGKILGLVQAYFGALSVDVVVAISDTGVIERPKKLELPEVCKADQAETKIKELMAEQKRNASIFNLNFKKEGRELSRTELANILTLLPASHIPLRANPIVLEKVPAPKSVIVPKNDVVHEAKAPLLSETTGPAETVRPVCATCGKSLSEKEEEYCRTQSARFADAFYCYPHQRFRRAKSASATV